MKLQILCCQRARLDYDQLKELQMKVYLKPLVAGRLVAAKFSACLLLVASDVATLRATQYVVQLSFQLHLQIMVLLCLDDSMERSSPHPIQWISTQDSSHG